MNNHDAPDIERVLDRISRLLAMSRDSSSPNEAMIAARRVRALMDKHQIAECDVAAPGSDARRFGESEADERGRRRVMWREDLADAAAVLNDCQCILHRNYAGEVWCGWRGFKLDVALAREMFTYLCEACDRGAQKVRGRRPRAHYRASFAVTVLGRCELISEERGQPESEGGCGALVPLKKTAVDAHFDELKSACPLGGPAEIMSRDELDAARAGWADGRDLSLEAQVCDQRQQASLLGGEA